LGVEAESLAGLELKPHIGLSMVPGMLAVASVIDGPEKLDLLGEVAAIIDSYIATLRSPQYLKALNAIDYPLLDAFELLEAIGVEGLEEVLSYAERALEGKAGNPPDIVEVYADLLGWNTSPKELEPEILGYAILISFTASFNKALNNIASRHEAS